jgi:hypothetical protein
MQTGKHGQWYAGIERLELLNRETGDEIDLTAPHQIIGGQPVDGFDRVPRRSRANLRPPSRSASVIDRLLKNQHPVEALSKFMGHARRLQKLYNHE